jgi:hypothetical protein
MAYVGLRTSGLWRREIVRVTGVRTEGEKKELYDYLFDQFHESNQDV